jgi:hypothetical protein
MAERIERSDWLEEEVGNLAREGLRTLVVACKHLTVSQYEQFHDALDAAKVPPALTLSVVRASSSISQACHLLAGAANEAAPRGGGTISPGAAPGGYAIALYHGGRGQAAAQCADDSGDAARRQRTHVDAHRRQDGNCQDRCAECIAGGSLPALLLGECPLSIRGETATEWISARLDKLAMPHSRRRVAAVVRGPPAATFHGGLALVCC